MIDNRAMSRIRSLFALVLLSSLVALPARAADEPATAASSGFRERYPTAALDSIPKADAALGAARTERARVERDYRTDARACMDRFLVNDCLNAARESRRKQLADVDAVEVDANRFKRRDRAEKSDAELARREAERAANEKADADLRARNKSTFDSRLSNAQRDADKAATRVAPSPKKPPPQPDAAAAAVQRAKNVEAHQQKIEDAAEHRADLERRRAEKVAARKKRAAEKAAKAAANPPPKSPTT